MTRDARKKAFGLIILFGLVSLFGDITYEAARSINGPYLKLLAVNATTLGVITGLGELLGYALRLLSGYVSDKTRYYWPLTFLGYGMLVSVPMLSLTGIWQAAAFFIIIERIGKAIRSPARDTILSQASSQVGTGFGFGLHEAMDQIGAVTGPLIFAVLFMAVGKEAGISDYQKGYAFLWVPFLMVMLCLFIAYRRVPAPEALEKKRDGDIPDRLSRTFWLYTVFTFIATTGFCSFILIGFHFKSSGILSDAQIPAFYAVAMAIDAAAALAIGKMYDILNKRRGTRDTGLKLLIIIPILTLAIPLLVFSKDVRLVIAGVLSWGIVMGIHETIMRSAIADLTSLSRRGMGYGIFNTAYGLAMFAGSALLGFLYDRSLVLVIVAVIVTECLALIPFFLMQRNKRHREDLLT